MEKELPKNWVNGFLYDLMEPVKTGVKSYENQKVYYSTGSIKDNELIPEGFYSFIDKPSRANREVLENDILQARMYNTDKALLISKDLSNALFSTGFIQLRPFKNTINSKFVLYYLKSELFNVQKDLLASGTTQVAINDENAKKITFPLPPLPEQNRIVAKLDTLFFQLETIKTSMAKIPLLLKDFRQQVLTQAVTGKLTEEWRKGKELGDSKELLSKIKEYYSSNKRWKEINIKSEDYLDIPATWQKSFIGNVADVSNGSTPSRKESSYWNGHIAWIGSAFIQNNRIQIVNEFITDEGFKNSSVRLLPKGTVLIAMIGEGKTRAQSAILDLEATINQNIAAMNVDHGFVKSEFLQYYLISNYDKHRSVGNGTGPQALNCQKVRELEFVLPPLEEQQEIVSRLESLFAKADAIEKQYESLKAKIDTLPQALLHKAFKGELTEQFDSDGDARELLEEIEALKAVNGKTVKSKTTKTAVKKVKSYAEGDGVVGMVAENRN